MPVTLTVDLDDKTGAGLSKLEQRLTNVGQAANESAKEFEAFAKGVGKTDKEIEEVEKSITKLARSSGQSEHVVRQLVMQSMNDRKVSEFKKQIKETADAFAGVTPKAKGLGSQLLELGKGWITFEFAKKVIGQTIKLIDELASRGNPAFKELKQSIEGVGDAFLKSFDSPDFQRAAGFFSSWANNAAKGFRIIDESGLSEEERKQMRETRRESVRGRFGAIDAADEQSRRLAGAKDPDQLLREMNQLKANAEQGANSGMGQEMIDAILQRYQQLQQRRNQLLEQMKADTDAVWAKEGEAQKQFIERNKETFLAYTKAIVGMEKDAANKRREEIERLWNKEHDLQMQAIEKQKATYAAYIDFMKKMDDELHESRRKKIDALWAKEEELQQKAEDAAKAKKDKRFDAIFAALGGGQHAGGMGAMAAGGLGGGMMGGPGAGVMGGGGLNFNPMTMQRFPFQGGGFFGMDPFRIARGGSGVMPTAWGTGASGRMQEQGSPTSVQGLLDSLDPKRVRRMSFRIARGMSDRDEDGNLDEKGEQKKYRELVRKIKRGEAPEIEAEARGRTAIGEVQRIRGTKEGRKMISKEADDELVRMVQKQTEANSDLKQQTQTQQQMLNALNQIVQQGQPRQGANRGNTGNKGRRR